MGSSLNKTDAINLKNNSGVNVNRGDVVVVDINSADSFTVTGSAQLATKTVGIVLDTGGILNGSTGLIAVNGYIPFINLVTGANIGDNIGLSALAQKAQSHSSLLTGDFGQTLSSGITPDVILWGTINNILTDYLAITITGGNINLGTSADIGFVDITGTIVNFIPKIPGKYLVIFSSSIYINIALAGQVLDELRITDGTTTICGPEVFFSNQSAVNDAVTIPFTIQWIFNWTDTTSKTLRLQKYSRLVVGSIADHLILADGGATGRGLTILISRIGT